LLTSVINPIYNTSFRHDWVASTNDVIWSSPCLLHRLISAFHDIHYRIKQFLIFKIYISLSRFFSLVSKLLYVTKLPWWRLIDWFLHFNDVIN
jgi:hypothetical protein